MAQYDAIRKTLAEKSANYIICDRKNAKKLVNKFLSKGWWFAHFTSEGNHYFAMSCSIDFQKDLKNIQFTLDM